jgi:myotubularin-related protein 1/2
MKLYANLNNYIFQKDHTNIFNFIYKYRELQNQNQQITEFNSNSNTNTNFDGWKNFNPKKEFLRQNLDFKDDNIKLKESNLNKTFGLCNTYPNYLIFPSVLQENEIKEASLFRSSNRLPTLSYYYNPNGKKFFGSLWRSSQNKPGLTNNRSTADEKLLKTIGDLGNKLYVYDARPYLAAQGNRVNFFKKYFIIY